MRGNLELLKKLSFLSDRKKLELYPPFWLMRVKVLLLDDHWQQAHLRLPLNWVSANAEGNVYGGYQANLADPIPALACMQRFPGYRIATRRLEVEFIRVGSTHLDLHFEFPEVMHKEIASSLKDKGCATPSFTMQYVRADGKVCTRIRNTVAIRPKGYIGSLERADCED